MDPTLQNALMLQAIKAGAAGGGAPPAGPTGAAMGPTPMQGMGQIPQSEIGMQAGAMPPPASVTPPVDPASMQGGVGQIPQNELGMQQQNMPGMQNQAPSQASLAALQALMGPIPSGGQ